MIKKISLSQKLVIGFGLILALLLIVSVIAYKSIESSSNGFNNYRELALETKYAGMLKAKMSIVRRNANNFIKSEDNDDYNKYKISLDKALKTLRLAKESISNKEKRELLINAEKYLLLFIKAISSIEVDIQSKNTLLKKNDKSRKSLKILMDKLTSSLTTNDSALEISLSSNRILNNILLNEVKLIVSKNIIYFEEISRDLSSLTKQLKQIETLDISEKNKTIINKIITSTDTHSKSLKKLKTVIGNIDKNSNVTLNSIGNKVDKTLGKIKKSVENKQDQLGPTLQDNNDKSVAIITGLSTTAMLLGILITILIIRNILKQLGGDPEDVVKIAQKVANGDLDINLSKQNSRNDSLYGIFTEMVTVLQQKANLAEQIANRDISQQVTIESEKDILGTSLQKMVRNLNETLSQVKAASEQIVLESEQISSTSQSLSQGATEQASNLEEISSSLDLLTTQTTENAECAKTADKLAQNAQQSALAGSNKMKSMISAIADINSAGQNISKIIKTIDEIAFQTNLLALNAAVEAARAGQHGKGFAVVAEEVRNLAARSAKAAEETSQLIEEAVSKSQTGNEIANETVIELESIFSEINKTSEIAAKIATANDEQAKGMQQINLGINQIDQVTQINTASAEESAAAAQELLGQATELKMLLAQFTLAKNIDSNGQKSLYESNHENGYLTALN